MLVIELRFFFHGLFHKKSTFSNLASSGLIRRNFVMSRINWLGNNFFFVFVFCCFCFCGFYCWISLLVILKCGVSYCILIVGFFKSNPGWWYCCLNFYCFYKRFFECF